ncbi:MerR family DNA-binding transcriptional regulator [Pseudooceanicola sp.]|uniref:MerR family DNA-binding transcriptional regulator n=1 Tax=Pseudooceanicola sp. TaxID=1914328 RepID=UPI0035C76D13
MSESRLSFKEMCERFDVTPRTLRYYEYIELLSPEREGRSRFYHPRDCARMKLILRGRKYGFSLEAIRQWLDIYDEEGSDAQMQTWVESADAQLLELESQRRQIDETIAELRALRDRTAASLEAYGESTDAVSDIVEK